MCIRDRYCLRHPFARLLNALLVIAANFMLYAEDPMAHSLVTADLPGVGNVYNLLLSRWPDTFGLVCLKLLMAVLGVAFGLLLGKKIIHDKCFRDCLQMQAFGFPKKLQDLTELDVYGQGGGQISVLPDGTMLRPQLQGERDKGSWFLMSLTAFGSVVVSSWIYNGMVADDTSARSIDGKLPMSNETFYKIAASGMWLATSVTFIFVWDMMAQDTRNYPNVLKSLRSGWTHKCDGNLRLHATWSTLIVLTVVVVTLVATDPSDWWDSAMEAIDGTNEVGRCAFASFITILDLLVILQDWEFPAFKTPNEIKMPGLSIANLSCPNLHVFITGKWFNYALMFFVLLIDIMMLKNNLFYHPRDTGQYVDHNNQVWTVHDPVDGHEYSWDERHGCCGDFKIAAKFTDEPLAHKVLSLFPCLIVFVCMVYLIRRSVKKGNSRGDGRLAVREIKPYMVPGRHVQPGAARAVVDGSEDQMTLAGGDSLAVRVEETEGEDGMVMERSVMEQMDQDDNDEAPAEVKPAVVAL
eukprot:TRINITY_DN6394_c0_g1_i2.p1 TRINITY_DN6394_c0_g1~~TRINITY_DN6394_c0_g1_i2.p1  ORF type:complete len:523 (+),score=107.10 TRINITY_DN6394_c0_g1_i2:93-1661(+)